MAHRTVCEVWIKSSYPTMNDIFITSATVMARVAPIPAASRLTRPSTLHRTRK